MSLGRHRALPGHRAERVPPEDEGLAEERAGDSVRARRGEQPADGEAETQGELSPRQRDQFISGGENKMAAVICILQIKLLMVNVVNSISRCV